VALLAFLLLGSVRCTVGRRMPEPEAEALLLEQRRPHASGARRGHAHVLLRSQWRIYGGLGGLQPP
jgi:hypothetical protein